MQTTQPHCLSLSSNPILSCTQHNDHLLENVLKSLTQHKHNAYWKFMSEKIFNNRIITAAIKISLLHSNLQNQKSGKTVNIIEQLFIFVLFTHPHIHTNKHTHSYSYRNLMLQCWDVNPDERPPFSKLVTDIDEQLTSMAGYIDFNQFNLITSSTAEKLSSSSSQTE